MSTASPRPSEEQSEKLVSAVPRTEQSVSSSGPRTVPPIEQSVNLAETSRDFLDRYYECRFMVDHHGAGHDYRLLFHSNGLVVVTLAPTHPLVTGTTSETNITGIDFQVTENTNRLDNHASGKGKRGAQVVTEDAPLFRARRADGQLFTVRACVRGKLVQMNRRLADQPGLLLSQQEGFFAIIQPKLGHSRQRKLELLDVEAYRAKRGLEEVPEMVRSAGGMEVVEGKGDGEVAEGLVKKDEGKLEVKGDQKVDMSVQESCESEPTETS